jgi:hypothetical protein
MSLFALDVELVQRLGEIRPGPGAMKIKGALEYVRYILALPCLAQILTRTTGIAEYKHKCTMTVKFDRY